MQWSVITVLWSWLSFEDFLLYSCRGFCEEKLEFDYICLINYDFPLTLKEPGYFDPSHSRGGADSAPP